MTDPRPIGVFDSGVGGLTVLRALQARLPQERFIYLGDTARLPYGTKSPETVIRYALQAADALVRREVKALVVACNTAAATALPAMTERYRELPVIGVVDPGAAAAVAVSRTGRIAVIATEATVHGGAYQRAIATRRPDARIIAVPCQLFVALAEEGWTEGAVAQAVAERYLAPIFRTDSPDTLVLGCTHFPMLRTAIRAVVGDAIAIVDSAETTATMAAEILQARGLLGAPHAGAQPAVRLLATDGVARFAAVGARFLERTIDPHAVELVDL